MKKILLIAVALLGAGLLWRHCHPDRGSDRYFADQTYHHLTLRALGQVPYGGADTGEVLQTIKHIHAGDAESWYAAWHNTADRVAALGHSAKDPVSRGRALLRAHNYYRTSEFLLAPNDERRKAAWRQQTTSFYEGLDALTIQYEKIAVPYGTHQLRALYFPGPKGSENRPLIVACGGFDSTLEELYFSIVAGARERGYSVLLYEGPGQGTALREQGLPFTPEWEKPTSAVLNRFLADHPRPPYIVLIGMSMGGYLAPRAAAFDSRIDAVASFDVLFDVAGAARAQARGSAIIDWLHHHQLDGIANTLMTLRMNLDPGTQWGMANGMWVMGASSPAQLLSAFEPFNLRGVADHIRGDVLILAGAADHLVPLSQVQEFQSSLTHARSVTTFVYDVESGGSEHCQDGAMTLWQRDFFDWLLAKFPLA